jgi:hypothetical protein
LEEKGQILEAAEALEKAAGLISLKEREEKREATQILDRLAYLMEKLDQFQRCLEALDQAIHFCLELGEFESADRLKRKRKDLEDRMT